MLREKLLWAQSVVLAYCAQHVTTHHTVPCHHALFLRDFLTNCLLVLTARMAECRVARIRASTDDHLPYSKRAMAKELVDVINKLGFPTFALIGHDRGGRVSYRMALDHQRGFEKIKCPMLHLWAEGGPLDAYRKSQLPVEVARITARRMLRRIPHEGYLKKWILPRWKSYRLPDVKAVQVEQWLKSLPLAPGTKAKIRNIMSALYSHALRWEWATHNPITQVRQSGQTQKDSGRLDHRAGQGIPLTPERALPPRGAIRCVSVGELLGLKMGGRELREIGSERHSFCGQAEDHSLQDGGFAQADSSGCGVGGRSAELEASMPVPTAWQWGVCQSQDERLTTILAGCAFPCALHAGARSSRNSRQRGLAYAASQVRHFDESEWRGHQDDSRAVAPFELQSDVGHLHPSHHSHQTCCPDKTGEDDFANKNNGGRTGLASCFFLLNLSEPSAEGPNRLLVSPTGFEPLLPP